MWCSQHAQNVATFTPSERDLRVPGSASVGRAEVLPTQVSSGLLRSGGAATGACWTRSWPSPGAALRARRGLARRGTAPVTLGQRAPTQARGPLSASGRSWSNTTVTPRLAGDCTLPASAIWDFGRGQGAMGGSLGHAQWGGHLGFSIELCRGIGKLRVILSASSFKPNKPARSRHRDGS